MTSTQTPPTTVPADGGGRRDRRAPKPAKARKAAKPSRATRQKGVEAGRDASQTVVNLLSPWVFEELRVHQLRRRFVLGALVLVVAVGLIWSGLRFELHRAEEELRGQEARGSALTVQIRDLAPVRTFVDGVQRRVIRVHDTAYDEVAFSRVLGGLTAAAGPGTAITSVSIGLVSRVSAPDSSATGGSAGTAPGGQGAEQDPTRGLLGTTCPGPDPFATNDVVGCLSIEGTASSRAEVGDLVVALGEDDLFLDPYVSTTTADNDRVSFSGTVGLSPKVFSGRYDDPGRSLREGVKK
ncbi:hypothetical protein E8D34_05770 [Nocardioides sp. GY 10113]|uniref:hypothetical protein n=1 Tax=Nocardioides sp. GY 10113 TaxID=2569761 RepID=UPI0010A8AB26|nr:hypothetical protein [Nocardioides sp. GY 10113]TIC88429.1 hypothetical protein E8D34_05770 [Nocardioides sp. GY 10113]